MNIRFVSLLTAAALLLVGCEGPKKGAQPSRAAPRALGQKTPQPATPATAPADAAKPGESPQKGEDSRKLPAQPTSSTPTPAAAGEIFAPNPTIDGRRIAPLVQGTPVAALKVRTYSFGEIPAPHEPAQGLFRIEPDNSIAEQPSIRSGTSIRSVVLKASSTPWESALIRHGIEVLDRGSLQWIEREHFLQEARLPMSPVAKREEMRATVVGRDNHQLLPGYDPLWILTAEGIVPLLSARSVAPDWKLAVGKHHAAQALLDLGDFSARIERLVRQVDQPTARTIAHAPRILGTAQRESPRPFTWQVDAADRFHLTVADGPTFFDPDKRALWTIAEAWVGHEVSRADYIARRTTTSHAHCPGCARVLAEKSEIKKPADTEVPARWKCPSCEATTPTRYVDGYKAAEAASFPVSLALAPRWLEAQAGTYPVLAAESATASALKSAEVWGKFEAKALEAATQPSRLGLEPAHDWCHIDDALVATLYPAVERRKLEASGAMASLRDDAFALPAVDENGKQEFFLTSEPTRRQVFDIPVVHLEVSVRAIGVEDARIVCAGTLSMSYQNLLTSAMELPVAAEGIDLSGWPGLDQQEKELRKELLKRLPLLLKP